MYVKEVKLANSIEEANDIIEQSKFYCIDVKPVVVKYLVLLGTQIIDGI